MKAGQLVGALALAAVLGGAAGGFVVTRFGTGEVPAAKAESARRAPAEDEPGEAEDEGDPEIEALRGRTASLERRISLLTAALARGQGAPAEGDDAEGEAKDPRSADVADPVFEAAVLDIVDRERERADGEREERRAELRTQRTARVSDALTEALGLDETQKVKVAELITSHFDALRALRSDDNPERPATPREWREKSAEIEQRLQTGLQTLLTSQQMAAYQALPADDQIGGGFGRRPRTEPRAEGAPAGR